VIVNNYTRIVKVDLFDSVEEQSGNLLHRDGIVNYYAALMSASAANSYFEALLNSIEWKNDEAFIFGKHFVTKRKVAWYGDKPFEYTYSNTTKRALPWTRQLKELKMLTEQETGESFNSCLLNLYHDGSEGMGWHSDAEEDLAKDGAIASLSFGAERKFCFKHKQSKQTVSLFLENGSLLVMKGSTQSHWLHRLPPTKKTDKPRINLTFRTIVEY
jgi:alkylated DNA repair dioxygenase AlkB